MRSIAASVVGLLGLGLLAVVVAPTAQAADPCATDPTGIACENTKPGTPSSEWDISGSGSPDIEGFATQMSVNVGSTVDFKVHSAADYTMTVYRMGFYGGDGARRIATLTPDQSVSRANNAGQCVDNSASTGLIDCGTWGVTASWAVPSTAVSGVYFALIEQANGEANHVMFVVRNDASRSAVLFQTSDTTWQAYNSWGGNSLYTGAPIGRAYKVSYNRPFNTRGTPGGRDFVWSNEYPMIRFLEAQGYDVSYSSGLDTARHGNLIKNHATFMTAGHDEYWSGAQRANVEAARDAGVNLAFFAGNDIYWKTRWEKSVDGADTADRTLVTYKETWQGARTDPEDIANGTWTGTWRDPRFSPPADGGRPENALLGTIFTVNRGTNAIKVPAAEGKLRLWRNTAAATQSAGQTYTTPENVLGYEWNEDLDNGFRPPGTIKLSNATYTVPEKLTDYGTQVSEGVATHNLTLYKAASGALVFSAGTVQWSWGLDAEHDGNDGAVNRTDPAMRQATVNLLADMGVQPATLQSGLTVAAKSTDTTAPTAAITSPVAGASLASGTPVTVTGTAVDVGGKVGGVEVSLDGGQSWHPASGRDSWTYTGTISGVVGASTVQARATDDSANIGTPVQRAVTVSCPCALFQDETPATASDSDRSSIELGVRFTPAVDGWVSGVTFFKGVGNTGTHTGTLWANDGTKLTDGTFTGETASGWQRLVFSEPVRVTAGTKYVASYHAPAGGYAATAGYFLGKDSVAYPLTAPRTTETDPNGVYHVGDTAFPTSTYQGGNYFVSPVFDTQAPADTKAPLVTAVTPRDNASSVRLTATPTVTFSEPMKAGTATLSLSSSAGLVPGATSFDSGRKVATFTPSANLSPATVYTLRVTGGTDDADNALPATTPTTFRTAQSSVAGVCPCTIWNDSTVPGVETADDPSSVELGVKFRSARAGKVTGVRFYKGPKNIGSHTGTLWSATGTELATGTFSDESSSGWQTLTFASPVEVAANTTYVASYHTSGYYSVTPGGLGSAVTRGPLTALASGTEGGNGVFAYGARAFPTGSFNAGDYGVDVVFEDPNDSVPPAVAKTSPAAGTTGARTAGTITATFTEKIASGLTATLRTGSTTLGSSVTWSADDTTATIVPDVALNAGTTYQVTLDGAKDRSGNAMSSPYAFSFTTSGENACPCSIYPSDYVPANTGADDPTPLELGVRFTPAVNGSITGMRFYQGPGNTGTHVGRLWTTGGALITSAQFSDTGSGWQQVSFPQPVPVTAGTTYVASYSAPNGHYAYDSRQLESAWVNPPLTAPASVDGAGNGVFTTTPGDFPNSTYNATGYGVDVVFAPTVVSDTVAPQVLSTSPVEGATSVPTNRAPVARFNEPVDAATVQASMTGPGGTVVPTTATGGADSTATITPSAALAPDTVYTVSVRASDLAGNPMAAPKTWTYRTAKAATTTAPYSIWTDESGPVIESDEDRRAVELGVRFRADSDGFVTGVRFWKGPGNTGTHTGTLWSASGTELATATFGGESASGWQQVTFNRAVAVTAGTTYVASYHAPNGGYSATLGDLGSAVTRGPLTALAASAEQPNGIYSYGGRAFPTSGTSTNYWVDVLFDTVDPTDDQPPTVTTVAPADSATAVPLTASVRATFSEAVTPASVQLTLKNAAGNAVAGTTTYDATTRTAQLSPAAALADSTVYTATATATDAAGNAMSAPRTWSFTTADTTAPTVGSRSPAPDATGVAVDAKVTAVFSEAIDPATLEFSVSDSGTPLAGTATYDAATRKATLTPTGSLPETTTLTARLRAADVAGNAMASASTWSFTTRDATAPTVGSRSPAPDATGVAVDARVTAVFSEAIDPATLQFTVSRAGTPVPGTATYDAATRKATFTPSGTLPDAVTLSASLRASDVAGNAMASPSTWSFTTRDATAPTVDSQSPAPGATGVAVDAKVTAVFSEAVDPATVEFTVSNGGSPVPGSTTYDAATRKATFTPTGNLPETATLTARLRASDTAGNAMPGASTWSFTTRDATAPTVGSQSPAPGATGVAVDARVTAVFSEAIDPATLQFGVSRSGTPVAGTTTYDAATRKATFTPSGALPETATLTASLRASDTAGNAMPSASTWSFTTADASPPTVGSRSPAPDATGVAADATVTAVFSEAVDPATVQLTVSRSGTPVAGSVTYDAATRKATFTPNGDLPESTTLTVSLRASDTAGNAMPSASTWSFTTRDGTAPIVTELSATASGTTAKVTWTTDEASTSVVRYGTSENALTQTATGAAGTTAHSVTLTGLTAGQLYFYKVTSADADGNAATAPPSASRFQVPGGTAGDLALGRAAAATSSYGTAPWGLSKVTDGVFTSTSASAGWSSDDNIANNHTEILQVDLGSSQTFRQVSLFPRTDANNLGQGFPITFSIQTSTTGSSWSTAQTVTNAPLPSTGQHYVLPSNVTARYVRITGTTLRKNPNNNAYRMIFAEIGVYPVTSTPGVTPPTVTAVTGASTGATTGTVSWTTNEPSSSVVTWGTSASALTNTVTGPANVTAHSVSLTGLPASTRIYYRVTSAGASGSSTTSPATTAAPASFAPRASSTQTTLADFAAGTQSKTVAANRDGGEVTLALTILDEFVGTTLGSIWKAYSLASGSSTTVANDLVSVNGQIVRSTTAYSSGRTMAFTATLRPGATKAIGLAGNDFASSGSHWAAFRTTSAGQLVAETRYGGGSFGSGSATASTLLSSALLGSAQRFEILWGASSVSYRVNGTTVATHNLTLSTSMYPAFRDSTVDSSPLVVDSVSLSPYQATGTFTSSVVDAGQSAEWGTFTPTATTPAGTSITYQVRTGPTATAGGTGWSAFTTVSPGGDIPGSGRYLQYRAVLTTSGAQTSTPELTSVSVAYEPS